MAKTNKLTLFLLGILVLIIFNNEIEAKGRGGSTGRSRSSGKNGRGAVSTFRTFKRGYRTSPAGVTYFGMSWYIITRRSYKSSNERESDTSWNSDIAMAPLADVDVDNLMFYSGILMLTFWFFSFCIKVSFKKGQHDLSDFSVVQLLTFVSYMAFIMASESVSPFDDDDPNADAWNNWFDNTTSFVAIADSPINWVDVDYYLSVIGFAMSILILIKENYKSKPTPVASRAAPAASIEEDWNGITKLNAGLFLFLWLPSLFGGLYWSWKIPIVVFSLLTLVASFTRYFGLMLCFKDPEKYSLAVLNGTANNPSHASRYRSNLRGYVHDTADFLGGFFSLVFHLRLAVLCEDVTVFFINFSSFGLGLFAVIFNPILIYFVWKKSSNTSRDSNYPDVSYEAKTSTHVHGRNYNLDDSF